MKFRAGISSPASRSRTAEGLAVLCVEDNPGDAGLLREMVKDTEMNVAMVCVETLGEAREKLGAAAFDVIFLDLSLPDTQGLETVSRMKAVASDVPIVVMTGLNGEAVGAQCMERGAQDYLVKGHCDEALLKRVLRYVMERRRAEVLTRTAAQRQDEKVEREKTETAANSAQALDDAHQRTDALVQIDQAKTDFFSDVSHEFRTPLTLMLGPLEDELAERGDPLPPARRERLKAVHRNSLRLLKLVNTQLDFSRAEAGQHEAHYVSTDLAAYTAELANRFRPTIEKARLLLTVDCPPLPEPLYVDREMWETIVLNLLSNAFKHTFAGGIKVTLRWVGDHAQLEVADSGVGIPATELPHLFERFHRVKGAKSRTAQGTGIGLALVEELARLHGGAVHVESREGKGSVFTVIVKAGRSHLPPEGIRADSLSAISAKTDEASIPKDIVPAKKNSQAYILVADDNADIREYMVRLLAPTYDVEAVEDGALALASIRKRMPDLVLSDVMMPHLDGVGLLHKLREDTETRMLPVIFLSALTGENAVIEGLQAGANDYLTKPFSTRELLARVRTQLDHAKDRKQWTQELERVNKELESFSYSIAHDLRAPLRSIEGFSAALLEDCGETLCPQGHEYIRRMRLSTQRMSSLINDLLKLSRTSQAPLQTESIPLSEMARGIIADWRSRDASRKVTVDIAEGLRAEGDPRLAMIVLENLLGNAWKYTAKQPETRISFGQESDETGTFFFIRDNGAGFDMAYASKLFGAFQRLHTEAEFEGTGIGLATVHRIISRHGGRIWAKATPGQGATFFFTFEPR